jgi:hypothetical protein
MANEPKPIDGVKKYQWAGLATRLRESKERAEYAIDALGKHYAGYDQELQEDDILLQAFRDARAGLAEGHISNTGVLQAMKSYGAKYAASVGQSTLGDLIGYNSKTGVKVPQDFLNAQRGKTIAKIVEGAQKGDEKLTKAYVGFEAMETEKMEAYLYPELVKEKTQATMKRISEEDKDSGNNSGKPNKRASKKKK